MRWRLVDRIADWRAWRHLVAIKLVSFEEYELATPLGLHGLLPPSLLLGAVGEAGAWLALASSDFARTALPVDLADWHWQRQAAPGDRLRIELTGDAPPRAGRLRLACRVTVAEQLVLSGDAEWRLLAAAELDSPAGWRRRWGDLHAAA